VSQQLLSGILTAVILSGLLLLGLGLSIWAFGLLARYNIPWEIQLAVLGILLLVFGALAARLLSRD